MITQQLIDYIKQKLEEGISEQEIKDTLIATGWSTQDLEEAFNTIPKPVDKEPLGQIFPDKPFEPQDFQKPASFVPGSLPGATKILGDALAIYKQRWAILLGAVGIPFLITFCFSFLFSLVFGGSIFLALMTGLLNPKAGLITATSLLGLLVFLFFIGCSIINIWGQTALLYVVKDRQEKIGIVEAYRRGWHKIISFWWVSFLSGLIVTGAFFLFIVPGIIFSVWFSLAQFILVAEGVGGMNALLKSREYVRGMWWSVFFRFLFIGFLSIIILLPLSLFLSFIPVIGGIINFIIPIILMPLTTVYLFLLYENIKAQKSGMTFDPRGKKKAIFIFCGFIGLLMVVVLSIFGIIFFKTAKGKLMDINRLTTIKQIQLGLDLYYEDHGFFPKDLDQLSPEYIKKMPVDPETNLPYKYEAQQDNKDYEICATLENETEKCLHPEKKSSAASSSLLEQKPYISTHNEFQINQPKGWSINDSGKSGIYVVFTSPQADQESGKKVAANINIVLEITKLDLASYVNNTKEMLPKVFENYKLTEDEEVTLNGRQAHLIGATFTVSTYKVRNLQLITVGNGKAYIVTATSFESSWEKNKDLLKASLLTFRID